MFIEEIEVAVGKAEIGVMTGYRKVLALCDEVWAIRPDEDVNVPMDVQAVAEHGGYPESTFKLVHRATGYAALREVSWDEALLTLVEIRRSGVNWAWTDPNRARSLKDQWRAIRAAARAALERRTESSQSVAAVDPVDGRSTP